jgi:hypothetical protein
MNKINKYLLFLLVLLNLSSCTTALIYADKDKTADFRNYRTFAWMPHENVHIHKNQAIDNELVEQNIMHFVNHELESRGLVADSSNPDVLIEYDIMTEKKVKQVDEPTYSNYYYYGSPYRGFNNYYPGYWGYNMNYRTVNIPYKEGTLTIDIIERKTKKLVWKGWAINEVTDPGSFKSELPLDIRDMFSEYPVRLHKGK